MGRSIDHRNTCVCGGKYLDSHRARHLTKSDKHLNWLAMQSSVQKQYQQECSPVNGQQTQSLGQSPSIMTDAQLIQFKQQVEWYNNYQQELIDKVTTDSELWWDSYDTDTDIDNILDELNEQYDMIEKLLADLTDE